MPLTSCVRLPRAIDLLGQPGLELALITVEVIVDAVGQQVVVPHCSAQNPHTHKHTKENLAPCAETNMAADNKASTTLVSCYV